MWNTVLSLLATSVRTVPAEEIVPENFNSADALMALIHRLDEE